MRVLRRLARVVATARHLSARQLRTRALRTAQKRWHALRGTRAPLETRFALRSHQPAEPVRTSLPAYEAGAFTFLNVTRRDPKWDEPSVSQLWRYHLHYFDYARELDRETFVRLASSWIAGNDRISGDGWHPYTISLRVVNWCDAADRFRDLPHGILASLYGQARFLAAHLEHDVRGNHLLKNLRALVWAGTFFDGPEPDRWRQRALELLRIEVAEQVLVDGGHFERVPGYHVQVLRDLKETYDFLSANGIVLTWLADAVARMLEYLKIILPPSGRLPLLKDTHRMNVSDLVPVPGATSCALEASGYVVVRDDTVGDHLIADFGRVCPDYLPAHAHADLFSFELTIGHRPTVVDSGVFEYAKGEWRDWFRSTAAHNTVVIGGGNQSDVYDSFRVGRRARPADVTFDQRGEVFLIRGRHDGYAPAVHRRTIAAIPSQRTWVIVDEVRGTAADAVRSYVHLHPDVRDLRLVPFQAKLREESGWYSEDFGIKVPNRVIALEPVTPVCFGYVISAGAEVSVEVAGGSVTVAAGDVTVSLP